MARLHEAAYRLRWVILVVGLLCLAAGILWLIPNNPVFRKTASFWCTPAMLPADLPKSEVGGWLNISLYVGLFLITHWLFLLPGRGWRIRLAQTSRPMKRAMAGAGFAAMLLTVSLVATLLEIPNAWWPIMEKLPGIYGVWVAMLALWVGWAWVFYTYWRQGDRYSRLGRILRGLIGGSILELVVAAPVQALVHDRGRCYCTRGSYTGLVFGGTVLLWAFGPGIVLLFLREKVRRERLLKNCETASRD